MNVRIVTTLCRAAILIIMLVIPILNTAALAGELAGARCLTRSSPAR